MGFAWLRNFAPLAGADSPTHLVTHADASHYLSCRVTISGDGGAATALSAVDGIPADTPARSGETLVGRLRPGPRGVSAPLRCSPQASAGCTVRLTLTAVAIVAHRRRTITAGAATWRVAAGHTRLLSVALNAPARRLLARRRRLVVALIVSGTVLGELSATLAVRRIVLAAPRVSAGARPPDATG